MEIRGPDGRIVEVTNDNRLKIFATTEPIMHALSGDGKAWSINGSITAADTTDNVIFYFENTSDEDLDCMGILVSTSIAGIFTLEYDRSYSSGGGTAKTLAQFNILSGKTQDQTSYIANDITLTGTGIDLMGARVGANSFVDLLGGTKALQLSPSGKIAVRFQADSGTPTVHVNFVCHGKEPWEE